MLGEALRPFTSNLMYHLKKEQATVGCLTTPVKAKVAQSGQAEGPALGRGAQCFFKLVVLDPPGTTHQMHHQQGLLDSGAGSLEVAFHRLTLSILSQCQRTPTPT